MNNEVENLGSSTIETPNNEEPKKGCWRRLLELAERCLSHEDKDKWLEQMRGNLGLMATVIATMTYQMALNPPGGIRSIRDDPHPRSDTNNAYAYPPGANNDYANSPGPNIPGTNDQRKYCGNFGRGTYWDLCPGQAVLGFTFPNYYYLFLVSNSICFLASISVCLLLVSGIRLNHRFPIWMLSIGMCITLTSLAASYIIAVAMTLPIDVRSGHNFFDWLIYVWEILLAIIGLWYTLRLVIWGVKHYRKRSKN